MPTFYDKLLQVPLLNLSVKGIDRVARSRCSAVRSCGARPIARARPAQPGVHVHLGGGVCGPERHARSGRRPSRPVAAVLAAGLRGWPPVRLPVPCRFGDRAFCNRGSGWACNEAGLLDIALSRSGEDLRRLDPAGAVEPLSRGCELGFAAACGNLRTLTKPAAQARSQPRRRLSMTIRSS